MSTSIYKRFQNFVGKAHPIHSNKYIYDEDEYVSMKDSMNITCPQHGPFSQLPTVHLRGYGCPSCGNVRDLQTFIQRAMEKHGGKYDYSNSVYTGTYDKILIECPEHGVFEQVTKDHLAGCGCLECDGTYKIDRNEFIKRAQQIHGNLYDYSPSVYRSNKTKLDILCQFHGVFPQTPNAHLRGQGCPECGHLGFYNAKRFKRHPEQKNFPCSFYVLKFTGCNEEFIKVGITRQTVESRFAGKSVYEYEILREEELTLYQAFKLEKHILTTLPRLKPKHQFGGWTECLSVNKLPAIIDIVDKKFYLSDNT